MAPGTVWRAAARLFVGDVLGAASFDEGDLVNFFQGRDPRTYFLQSRIPQEGHSLFSRRSLDFGRGTPPNDHFTDAIGKVQEFGNGRSAVVSRARTFQTSRPFRKGHRAPDGWIQTCC